jgi:hypothetical protein
MHPHIQSMGATWVHAMIKIDNFGYKTNKKVQRSQKTSAKTPARPNFAKVGVASSSLVARSNFFKQNK